MKIDGTESNRIQKDSRVNRAKDTASGKNKKSEILSGDGLASEKVIISNKAKDIQKAIKTASESPDIRVEKVQEIKGKIESGEYRIDSKEIANKMLKDLLI